MAINCEDGEAALGIAYELLDHYLDRPRYDWGAAWQQVVKERDEKAVKLLKEQTAAPAKVGPSLPLERYAGEYADRLVRADRDRAARRTADDRLQADARHDGRAHALAIRHVQGGMARPADRAGLRDVRARAPTAASTASACARSRPSRTSASTTRTSTSGRPRGSKAPDPPEPDRQDGHDQQGDEGVRQQAVTLRDQADEADGGRGEDRQTA